MNSNRDELQSFINANPEVVEETASTTEAQNSIDKLSLDKYETELLLSERKEIIKMRSHWSKWLLLAMMLIVLFDMVIITLLGLHIISFQADYIIPTFIVDSLIKTLGLAYIVVNFLFNIESVGKSKK